MIDAHYEAEDGGIDGVVTNPGGLCYSGYALRDCMKGIELPVMEVHMSNHYARGKDWSNDGAQHERHIRTLQGREGELNELESALRQAGISREGAFTEAAE